MITALFRQLRLTLEMIRIEHTVFALPFAFLGAVLAERRFPDAVTCAWILLAMVGARSAAMAFNRLADLPFDRENPRTSDRVLPQGRVSRRYVLGFTVSSALLMLLAAYMLNPLAFILAFPALLVILGYSLTKRFTSLTHIVLGFALSIAPAGGWIAVTGTFDPRILLLSVVVVTWVAGFDILYACQDLEHDRAVGLHSLPAFLGGVWAFRVARVGHGLSLLCLVVVGALLDLGPAWSVGLGGVATLLVWEHALLSPEDLSRMQQAFFTCNAAISLSLLAACLLEILT